MDGSTVNRSKRKRVIDEQKSITDLTQVIGWLGLMGQSNYVISGHVLKLTPWHS